MTSPVHASPGGQAAVTYQVIESQFIQGDDVSTAAVAGRSNDGVHLLLTPAAAAGLAEILTIQEQALAALDAGDYVRIRELLEHDAFLWNHVAVDLLAHRAMALNADTLGQNVVYATAYHSGYLPPRPRRRLEVVDAGGDPS